MEEKVSHRPVHRRLREAAKTAMLAGLLYLVVELVVPPYAVDDASMSPTLSDG